MDWSNVYITDKTGKKFFNNISSPMATIGAIRDLSRHIENSKKYPAQYHFLDIPTAQVMVNGVPYGYENNMSADELLAELGM